MESGIHPAPDQNLLPSPSAETDQAVEGEGNGKYAGIYGTVFALQMKKAEEKQGKHNKTLYTMEYRKK